MTAAVFYDLMAFLRRQRPKHLVLLCKAKAMSFYDTGHLSLCFVEVRKGNGMQPTLESVAVLFG